MSESHLTEPHDERIKRYRAQTAAGMAHWSGTGPANTLCMTCDHAMFNGYYAKQNKGGALKPIQCAKYRSMMDGTAPKFDANHKSCRFYVPGSGPPKKV